MFCRCGNIFIWLLVAAITVGAYAATLTRSDRSHRVIGGVSVNIEDRPYMVQLRVGEFGLFVCGGILVRPNFVITAAHCLEDFDPVEELVVVGNATSTDDEGIERNIIASIVHPGYRNESRYDKDIAVVQLDSPMTGGCIKTIELGLDDIRDNQFMTISGWGTTELGVTGTIPFIRTARLKKIPFEECASKYKNHSKLTRSMVCAAAPGKDACQGDSGGPAVYRGKLYAVVSWGKNCANSDFPGVYTSLSSVKDFLVENKVVSE